VDQTVNFFPTVRIRRATVLEAGTNSFCLPLHVAAEIRPALSADVLDGAKDF
jgi:hypothetical protein